jgi:hypothetical protein
MNCCICKKEIPKGHDNNPFPYKLEGRCCDACNMNHVIPARMAAIHQTPACKENRG